MPNETQPSLARMPIAGLLAWLVPGLGHLYLGDRSRGLVLLVTITVTFWSGVAIGGVRGTVDPQERKLWFVAQVFTAGNAAAAWSLNRVSTPPPGPDGGKPLKGDWSSSEVGVHYTGVAGLLNLLVILDAIGRADPAFIARRRRREAAEGAT